MTADIRKIDRRTEGVLVRLEDWPGVVDRKGYAKSHGRAVHRREYERAHGPIPTGMTVDHLCFQPSCMNTAHMRLISHDENRRNQRSAVKTHCVNGHEYTPENTYTRPQRYGGGRRDCRLCIAARVRAYTARKRNAA